LQLLKGAGTHRPQLGKFTRQLFGLGQGAVGDDQRGRALRQ
jgi:hypothetical protein